MSGELYANYWSNKEPINDTYRNETGIVICNGDSLRGIPVEFLDRYPTIAMNNFYLYGKSEEEVNAYKGGGDAEVNYMPTFYVIMGLNQIDTLEKVEYPKPLIEGAKLAFVSRLAYPFYAADNVYPIHGIDWETRRRPFPKEKFSYVISHCVGIGYTNTYIALQIMYYLGFTMVFCVGLDNDYGANPHRLHFYPNDRRFACEPSRGRTAHRLGSNYVFSLAKAVYEADGREIININGKNNTPFEGIKMFHMEQRRSNEENNCSLVFSCFTYGNSNSVRQFA